MRGLRYDRILAGTALAVVLAAPIGSANAQLEGDSTPVTTTISRETSPEAPVPVVTPNPAPASVTPARVEPTSVAPTEQAPPDPLASLDPADRPIAEKMRDLLGAKIDRIFANKKERSAVEAFYEKRNLAPLWIEKGIENARVKAAVARLQAADTDGLIPSEYKIPDFSGSTDAQAEAELRLTATVLTFARHLQAGRFPFARIGRDIEYPQQPPDPTDVLTKIADTTDVATVFDGFSPPHAGYKALKSALADLRAKAGGSTTQIPDGKPLKLNKVPMEDPRVPALRERLGVAGDPADHRYDSKLAEAVKKFQRGTDINATGVLDSRTVRELNGPPRDRQIDVVLANMERWRWLPRDLGKTHVIVNIPEYSLRVMNGGSQAWVTRIVVGKPNLQTPLLSAQMKYITVNPTWNVPPSIVQNEYLPALQQDPTVLSRMGLRVVNNPDGSIHIYQPPGDGNALGRIRFNFPNRFLVYQHDTPDKNLFAHDRRAYSHGCMRVQDPLKYAEVLLSIIRPNDGYTQERLRKLYGNAEHDIQFPTFLPVHLTYQTASVDEHGKLVLRGDIYNYDSRIIAAIKSERGMVEVAEERPKPVSSTPIKRVQAPPQQPRGFFESLFGGNSNATAAPAVRPQGQVRQGAATTTPGRSGTVTYRAVSGDNRPVPPNRIR